MAHFPAWNRLFGRVFIVVILAKRSAASIGLNQLLRRLSCHVIQFDESSATIFGMGREVAIQRCIGILFKTTTNLHDLPRMVVLLRFSIRSTAWESRLMRDALTIVVFHVSRQQGQSLLHVGQEFRLKAGAEGGACGRHAATLRPRNRRSSACGRTRAGSRHSEFASRRSN
jgi:hypothetical protein